MSKSNSMNGKAAARIQSASAKGSKSGRVSKVSFASRAQRAASKNNK